MKKESEKNKKNMMQTVVYHNDIDDVPFYGISAVEYDLVMALFILCRDEGTRVLELDFADIKRFTKYSKGSYARMAKDLRDTNSKLLSYNIMISRDSEGKVTEQFNIFNKFTVDEKKQKLTVQINEDFAYLLNNIEKNFTAFSLLEFITLSSKHAKGGYRALKRYADTGYVILQRDDFVQKMLLPENVSNKKIENQYIPVLIEELGPYFKDLEFIAQRASTRGRPITGYKIKFAPQKNGKSHSDEYICPLCGDILTRQQINNQLLYAHKDGWKENAKCKATFENVSELKKVTNSINEQKETDGEIKESVKIDSGYISADEEVLCPYCNEPLLPIKISGNIIWAHPSTIDSCDATFTSYKDIMVAKCKRTIKKGSESERKAGKRFVKCGITCPICGDELSEGEMNGSIAWCHPENYGKEGKCQKIWNAISDIREYENKKNNDTSSPKEVKKLIKNLF